MPELRTSSGSHSVPYQAYKSKRHSRNLSSTISPNATPLPSSRPSSSAGIPIIQTSSQSFLVEKEMDFPTNPSSGQRGDSPEYEPVLNPRVVSKGLPSPPASIHSHESYEYQLDTSTQPTCESKTSEISAPVVEDTSNFSPKTRAEASPNNGLSTPPNVVSMLVPSSVASTSTSSTREDGEQTQQRQDVLPKPIRKVTSTFRRVPLRTERSTQPSPLAPHGYATSHSRSASLVSNLTLHRSSNPPFSTSPNEGNRLAHNSTRLLASSPSIAEKQLPSASSPAPSTRESAPQGGKSPAPINSGIPAPPSIVSSPISKTSSSSSNKNGDINMHPTSSRLLNYSVTPATRILTPFRAGFQPRGYSRHRTDEFLAIRRIKRDGEEESGGFKRVERTKLERRLEKITALHFPLDGISREPREKLASDKSLPNMSRNQRRPSSFFVLESLRNIKVNEPNDLWRALVSGGGLGESNRISIREAEQRITPWQDDAEVTKCPLCATSFHSLTNRRHHCRLCGKIICSLPPKRPQRPTSCSMLFVIDPKTRQIEEVGEGVDYGVRKRKTSRISEQTQMEEEEKFLKGVRVCRDCWPILLKQQRQQEIVQVPDLVKFCEALVNIEKEIEMSLPQFQELLVTLSNDDQTTKDASPVRKRLLEAFSQYDALAKNIRKIPCTPGSSQDRVQTAIMTRASLFLQKNMVPLRSLPKSKRNGGSVSDTAVKDNAGRLESQIDPDSELAQALQPLLEQEALLESFVEEANAHRKFEDAKTLRRNLQEIRQEIERLLSQSEVEGRINIK